MRLVTTITRQLRLRGWMRSTVRANNMTSTDIKNRDNYNFPCNTSRCPYYNEWPNETAGTYLTNKTWNVPGIPAILRNTINVNWLKRHWKSCSNKNYMLACWRSIASWALTSILGMGLLRYIGQLVLSWMSIPMFSTVCIMILFYDKFLCYDDWNTKYIMSICPFVHPSFSTFLSPAPASRTMLYCNLLKRIDRLTCQVGLWVLRSSRVSSTRKWIHNCGIPEIIADSGVRDGRNFPLYSA